MSIRKDLIKFTPRVEQQKALEYLKTVIQKKPDNKFFMFNMAVGIGKSHFAVMAADYITTHVFKDAKVDIITAGKLLQDQYEGTYDEIKSLRGKDNYECVQYACSCEKGKEFNRLNKTKCEFCPYDSAKIQYMTSEVNLTNFHLYLINAIYGSKMFEERESRLLIVDECLHPDTEITMSDGSKKKIKDIVEGELVITINEETNKLEVKPVVKLHHNLNKGVQMYEIEMENGDIIKITGNHKVKLIDGTWKKAEDLKEDDEILYINEKIESHEFDNRGKEYNI